MRRLYPYETLFGDLALSVRDVEVDGRSVPVNVTDRDNRRVFLSTLERKDWESASIDVVVRGPAVELERRAEDWAPIGVVVIVNGRGTYANMRNATTLDPDEDERGVWVGTVELSRADWFGRAEVAAHAVGTVESIASRVVGVSESWVLDFDDLPPSPVGGSIPVNWDHFENPREGNGFLKVKGINDKPYFLKIESATPHLYLNQDFEGLHRVLRDRGRRLAADQAVHDHLRAAIAVEVHTALFHAAIQAAEIDDDGNVDPPPEDWQRAVLDSLLPRMFPGRDGDEALREAANLAASPEAAGTLQELLVPAVLDVAQFSRLIRHGMAVLEHVTPTSGGDET